MPARRAPRRRPLALYRKLLGALRGPCAVPRGDTVVVACSGGPDSLALLLGLAELAPRLGIGLVVAHLDHGARPGSAADAGSVLRRTRALGLPFRSDRVRAPRLLRERGLSGEAGLRVLRREFLERARRAAGARWIAVAHTADDQAETLLLRLARGTGLSGLSGMRPRRGAWLRPLLEVTRAEVAEFLADRGARGRRDPTNRDLRRARNRVRHRVLPELARVHAGAAESIAAMAGRLAQADALVRRLGARALERALADSGPPEGSGLRLVRARWLGYHPAIRESVLRHAWSRVCPLGPQLTRRHLRAVEGLLERGVGRSIAHLPGRRVARLEGGLLFLGPGPAQPRTPASRDAPRPRRTSSHERKRS